MTTIDRQFCSILRANIEKDLAALGAKYGLKISGGNAKYTANDVTMQVVCKVISPDGKVFDRTENDFSRMAHMYGLKPDDMGRTFTSSTGERFTICGLKPQNTKFPIIAKNYSGKPYKFPSRTVVAALARVA